MFVKQCVTHVSHSPGKLDQLPATQWLWWWSWWGQWWWFQWWLAFLLAKLDFFPAGVMMLSRWWGNGYDAVSDIVLLSRMRMRSTLGFVMNLGILISKVAMAAVMNKKPSDTSGMLEIIFIGPGQSAPPLSPSLQNLALVHAFFHGNKKCSRLSA